MDTLYGKGSITGIVLAGGKSTRMGKQKGICKLNNKFLIAYAIESLLPVCNQIMISANEHEFDHLGYTVVVDRIKNAGPAGGIYSCLSASKTENNFILSCDMPLVSVDLIRHILSEKEKFDIVVPVFNNLPEPLCACYNKSIAAKFQKLLGQNVYKMQEIVKHFRTGFLSVDLSLPFYSENLFTNINTPADLEKIEKFISNKVE